MENERLPWAKETEEQYRQRPAYLDGAAVGVADQKAGRRESRTNDWRECVQFIAARGFRIIPDGERPGVARDTDVLAWRDGYERAFEVNSPNPLLDVEHVGPTYEDYADRANLAPWEED